MKFLENELVFVKLVQNGCQLLGSAKGVAALWMEKQGLQRPTAHWANGKRLPLS